MLDVYRFILALCVVQWHLSGYSLLLATQAVFSFYVLSGFLMSLILNESYGFTSRGLARFALNRGLRLLPVYYVVIGLTAAYIVLVGPLNQISNQIHLPLTLKSIVANLSVVTLPSITVSRMATPQLAPTAWSLGVEIFCYCLLALYFARTARRLIALLAVGAVIAVVQVAYGFDELNYGFQNRYNVLQAGMVPFALGGLAYFWRSRLENFSVGRIALLSLLLILNAAIGRWSDFHTYVSGIYVAAFLNMLLVPALFSRKGETGYQKIIGGLSYPVFLSHWTIGTLVLIYLPVVKGSAAHVVISTLAAIAFSLLLWVTIDVPMQKLRSAIKAKTVARSLI